jgi:hypothetical protein
VAGEIAVKKLLKAPYVTNLMLAIVALELWFLVKNGRKSARDTEWD